MKAIILAGGSGSRLRPLTCCQPKPLMPVLGTPVMEHTLELLKKHGFSSAGVTVRYLCGEITRRFGESCRGVKLEYFCEKTPLGTAGSVLSAGEAASGPLLVISGDALTDIDLTALIARHKANQNAVTIALKSAPNPREYGVVLLNERDEITGFSEKPDWSQLYGDLVNTGIYVVEPRAWEGFEKGREFDFAKDMFTALLQRGETIGGFVSKDYWCDIGNLGEYMRANRDALDGLVRLTRTALDFDGIYVENGAQVDASAILKAPCYIGRNARIGRKAVIDAYSVIGADCVVEEYASVRRSVLWDGAFAGRGSELRGAVICSGAVIESGCCVFEGCVAAQNSVLRAGSRLEKGARLWPEKRVAGAADADVVWGEASLRACVEGTEALPSHECFLRLGRAVAGAAGKKAAVSCDGSEKGAAARYALISGLLSGGADVYDMENAVGAVLRRCSSLLGASVCIRTDGERVRIFGGDGTRASGTLVRSVVSALEQCARPSAQTGLLLSRGSMLTLYCADVIKDIDVDALRDKRLVYFASDADARVIAMLLAECGCSAVRAADADMAAVRASELKTFALGIADGELTAATLTGNLRTDEMRMLSAEALIAGGGKEITADCFLPEIFAEKARERGVAVKRLHSSQIPVEDPFRRLLCVAAYLFKSSLDIESAKKTLPKSFSSEKSVETARRDIGRIMRAVINGGSGRGIDRTEGVRVCRNGSWVHILPSDGFIRITVNSDKEEYAEELSTVYARRIERLKNETT